MMTMTSSGNKPSKRAIVDALVLAFSNSAVREVVGTDALRSVLEVEFHEMITGTELNLQPLWDLLSEQPGFVAHDVIPPICLFAQWTNRLHISVVLPQTVADLEPGECNQRAMECKVPYAELEAVINPSASPPPPSTPRATPAPAPAKLEWTAPASQEKTRKARPPWLGPAAAVVALICFGFAAMQLMQFCGTKAEWAPLSAANFAGDLPITNPRKLGNQVGAVLTDPNWVNLPEATKRDQLEKALFALDDARVLFIEDKNGKVRATVQISGSAQQLHFTFR